LEEDLHPGTCWSLPQLVDFVILIIHFRGIEERESNAMSEPNPATRSGDESPPLYGVVTVGERGQIVIPAEARKDLGLSSGDKLVVLAHPFEDGLVLFKAEKVESILQRTLAGLTRLKDEIPE